MIIKQRKYKHRKKKVDTKQEKQISKLRQNKVITEKVNLNDKIIEINRPMFYIEAKEQFFNNMGRTKWNITAVLILLTSYVKFKRQSMKIKN